MGCLGRRLFCHASFFLATFQPSDLPAVRQLRRYPRSSRRRSHPAVHAGRRPGAGLAGVLFRHLTPGAPAPWALISPFPLCRSWQPAFPLSQGSSLTSPKGKGRRRGPSVPMFPHAASPVSTSEGFVVRSLYSLVRLGKLSMKGTMALPHLMRPRPDSTLVM